MHILRVIYFFKLPAFFYFVTVSNPFSRFARWVYEPRERFVFCKLEILFIECKKKKRDGF